MVLGALAMCVAALARPQRARRIVNEYFLEPSGPLNLAVFRVALFAYVLHDALQIDVSELADLPSVLRKTP